MTVDLATNRRLTKAFIDQLPTTLVLTPHRRVRGASGAFENQELPPREPQTFTIIEGGGVGALPRPTVTQDGVERVVEFELLGEHTAELAPRDTFTHQGKEWEVIDLFYDNGYERRALVSAR